MTEIKMSVPMTEALRSGLEDLALQDGRPGGKYAERVLAQHVSKKTGVAADSLILIRKKAKP